MEDPNLQAWIDLNPYEHDELLSRPAINELPEDIKYQFHIKHLIDEYEQGLNILGSTNNIKRPLYVKELEWNNHVYICEAYPTRWRVNIPDWWNLGEKLNPLGSKEDKLRLAFGNWICMACG